MNRKFHLVAISVVILAFLSVISAYSQVTPHQYDSPNLSFEIEMRRLDSVASELKLDPEKFVYLIGFNRTGHGKHSALTRLNKSRIYLIQKHRISKERIKTLYGGSQDALIMQIRVVKKSGATTEEPLPASQADINSSSLAGRVTDLMGRPLDGARVSIKSRELPAVETRTDPNGRYLLTSLNAGTYDLLVSETGFQRHESTIYLNPGEKTVFDVGLQAGLLTDAPDLVIYGIVTDSDRKKVENATVIARSVFKSQLAIYTATTKTGEFELQLPSYGQYLVYTYLPGRQTDPQVVVVRTDKKIRVDLKLR